MKRHSTDVTSLVFGLLFLGVAVLWLMVDQEMLTLPTLGLAAPALLIAIGLAGLFGSLKRSRGNASQSTLGDELPTGDDTP